MTMLRRKAAFTLIEIIIAMTIFLVALIPISWVLISFLKESNNTVLHTRAVFLAQEKAAEVLRDDTTTDYVNYLIDFNDHSQHIPTTNWAMYNSIKDRTVPTDPLVYPGNPQLYYCFSGSSIIYDKNTDEGKDGIARVIVLRNPVENPADITAKDVLYELRFGHP